MNEPVEDESQALEPAASPTDLPADAQTEEVEEPAISPVEPLRELSEAQKYLDQGDIQKAVEEFATQIRTTSSIEDTIQDLLSATQRFPEEVGVWEKLGDAYARANRLQEALDAYTKAEDLLR
jgi:tetratricopeptide (TPR) repeat protein